MTDCNCNIFPSSNVGIRPGSDTPAADLDIGATNGSSPNSVQLRLGGSTNQGPNVGTKLLINRYNNDAAMEIVKAVDENNNQDLLIKSSDGESNLPTLYFRGNVGIAKTNPDVKLHVGGDVKLDGALAQINGRENVGITSNGFDDLINNFDGSAYWFSGTQGGDARGTGGTRVMKLQADGRLELSGAIAQINGRENVGITSNGFDDLINNFDGAAYWFSGTQGGDTEGTGGTRAMKLQADGRLELSGAIAQINGRSRVGITANSLDELINNFDGTAYWFSGTQGGDSTGSAGDEAMKLNDDGDLYLSGALARIRGRDNVGITSNVFDDLIHNFDGAVYWFKGIQGGRSEGSGTRLMKLDSDGDLEVAGRLEASNSVKEYDSGWFDVSALDIATKSHNLGVMPKHVTVWCANRGSGDPTSPSIAGPFVVNTAASGDRGAYVAKVTTTSLVVRAGSHIGINEANNGWLTSGRYRVIAWA